MILLVSESSLHVFYQEILYFFRRCVQWKEGKP